MELYKKTYRVSEEAKRMVEEIAAKENCTETAVFENAIRCYRDYLYVQNNGAFITESVKRTVLASVNLMESRLNNRTNKVLSERSHHSSQSKGKPCTRRRVTGNLDLVRKE